MILTQFSYLFKTIPPPKRVQGNKKENSPVTETNIQKTQIKKKPNKKTKTINSSRLVNHER